MTNTAESLLRSLLGLWQDLPRLCGARWAAVERDLERIVQRLLAAVEPAPEAYLERELALAFRDCPEVSERLFRPATRSSPYAPVARGEEPIRTRGGPFSPAARGEEPPVHKPGGDLAPLTRNLAVLSAQVLDRIRPALVTRHMDVNCPDRVYLKTPRFALVVRLLATPSDDGHAAAPPRVQAEVGGLRVHLEAPGFALLNGPWQRTEVRPDGDSSPVVFDLRPERAGQHRLLLTFLQNGNPVGTASVSVECTEYEVAATTSAPPIAPPVRSDPSAVAPDLILLIDSQNSELRFTLLQHGGSWWRSFPPVKLTGDAGAYAAGLYGALTGLATRTEPVAAAHAAADGTAHPNPKMLSPEETAAKVKTIGQNLWLRLIPAELKAVYEENRAGWQGRSLLLLSDEPNVPWELVWPYAKPVRGGSPGWEDAQPWCCTFRLTRWLRLDEQGQGNESPPTRLTLRAMAVLAPQIDARLTGAQGERQSLLALARSHGVSDVSPPRATVEAVRELLRRGGYDWLHVASHGNFYKAAPESNSALWLEDLRPLTPNDVVGPDVEGHLSLGRPAFFFNACELGRQGMGLVGMEGWAARLVSAGAGLFAGAQWEITDERASVFVDDFYRRLFDGLPVGEALRQARLAAQAKGDPTWLAYTVYAHPNAIVSLSDHAE